MMETTLIPEKEEIESIAEPVTGKDLENLSEDEFAYQKILNAGKKPNTTPNSQFIELQNGKITKRRDHSNHDPVVDNKDEKSPGDEHRETEGRRVRSMKRTERTLNRAEKLEDTGVLQTLGKHEEPYDEPNWEMFLRPDARDNGSEATQQDISKVEELTKKEREEVKKISHFGSTR